MPYVEILPNSYNAGLLEEQEMVACKKYTVVFSPYLDCFSHISSFL